MDLYSIGGLDMSGKYNSYTVQPERRSNEITKEWEKRLKADKVYPYRRRTERRGANVYRKSTILLISEVLTLISAVFNTIILLCMIPDHITDSLSMIFYITMLVLVWLGRYKIFKEDHRGWMIYSLFIGLLTRNIFDIIGYTCVLIHSYKYR